MTRPKRPDDLTDTDLARMLCEKIGAPEFNWGEILPPIDTALDRQFCTATQDERGERLSVFFLCLVKDDPEPLFLYSLSPDSSGSVPATQKDLQVLWDKVVGR